MSKQKTGKLWLLCCLYGTDVQGPTVLVDVWCLRYSKSGIGTAVKCQPLLTQQPVLTPPAQFFQPSFWAPHCLAHLHLLHVWVSAACCSVAAKCPAGWFSEATPAQQCSCSAICSSNTLLTERCLHKHDRFWDICRKSFIRVFQFFNNDFHFCFYSRKSRAYTGH